MIWDLQDITRQIKMWVSLHLPLGNNPGIDTSLNQSDYPWIIHYTLPFSPYAGITPLAQKFSLSPPITALWVWRLSADIGMKQKLGSWYFLIDYTHSRSFHLPQNISMKEVCLSNVNAICWQYHFCIIMNTLSLNCCHWTATQKVPKLSSSADS